MQRANASAPFRVVELSCAKWPADEPPHAAATRGSTAVAMIAPRVRSTLSIIALCDYSREKQR
jgi:hypothetical protein